MTFDSGYLLSYERANIFTVRVGDKDSADESLNYLLTSQLTYANGQLIY